MNATDTTTAKKPGTVTIKPIELKPLDSVDNCAEVLGVDPRTVRRMCVDGQVKAMKVRGTWRVNTADMLNQFGLA